MDMGELLRPYTVFHVEQSLLEKLAVYLELLQKWNRKTNLTAVREPEEMVRRHFGESLLLAEMLPEAGTLLDFGSGAGFPGLPVALAKPGLLVTLAESQGKKASFLREAVRTLGVPVEVFAGRVETLGPEQVLDVVTLRAVDQMGAAVAEAARRVAPGGVMGILAGRDEALPEGFELVASRDVPGGGLALVGRRISS